MKKKIPHHSFAPMPGVLYCIYEREVPRLAKQVGCPPSALSCDGNDAITTLAANDETGEMFICIVFREPAAFSHGTLAHECLHAVLDLSHHVQDTVHASHAEPWCYIMGAIYEFALKRLRTKPKRKRSGAKLKG